VLNLADQLTEAGAKYDGRHVTNGSCEAQVNVVRTLLREIKSRLKLRGDFGEFSTDIKYPEIIACEIIDEVAKEYGL
jgi:hypothetical protein